ncbi:MAG: ABC transporter ATP-binding protein [Phycisphaerae bacterium]
MIQVQQLTKRFASRGDSGVREILAVDGVTFSVQPGEVVGFLGPNGAGKSTTMKMVTGYLSPTSGTAKVAGFDVQTHTRQAQQQLGYLPEGAPAYPDMTPEGFLQFCADARGLKGDARKKALDKAIARTNLQGVLRQSVETLSKGFKRRVGLAQAILHEPRVLIMDEPTDGLDPNQKHEVRALIREMAREGSSGGENGKAIVLSTHILEEVDAVCSRVVMIAKGKLVADCTPAELLAKSRYHNAVTVTVRTPSGARVREELLGLQGVKNVEIAEDQVREGAATSWTALPHETNMGPGLAPKILDLCKQRGWNVDAIRMETGRLDDVFREMTVG